MCGGAIISDFIAPTNKSSRRLTADDLFRQNDFFKANYYSKTLRSEIFDVDGEEDFEADFAGFKFGKRINFVPTSLFQRLFFSNRIGEDPLRNIPPGQTAWMTAVFPAGLGKPLANPLWLPAPLEMNEV